MNRLKSRMQQKTAVEAFNLLDKVDKNRKERRYKQALDNTKKAQKIFRDIDWIKEADDMEKMIRDIEKELKGQEKAVKKTDGERLQKIKSEEEEEEKIKKIIEARRKKRRAARKKL